MRNPDYGDISYLKDHPQCAQDILGSGHIIHQESRHAFTLLYIRLESQDIHPALGKSEEALATSSRFVLNSDRKLLRLRHVRWSLGIQNTDDTGKQRNGNSRGLFLRRS